MTKATKLIGLLALTAVTMVSRGTVAAAKDSDTPLTLTGCVVPGEAKDSFLVTNVTVEGQAPSNAYYRLDSTKELRKYVGQRVEITGAADLTDLDKGKLKVKTDDHGNTTTSVTSERKTVKVDDNVFFGTLGASNVKADIATYGFEVKKVRRVDGACSK